MPTGAIPRSKPWSYISCLEFNQNVQCWGGGRCYAYFRAPCHVAELGPTVTERQWRTKEMVSIPTAIWFFIAVLAASGNHSNLIIVSFLAPFHRSSSRESASQTKEMIPKMEVMEIFIHNKEIIVTCCATASRFIQFHGTVVASENISLASNDLKAVIDTSHPDVRVTRNHVSSGQTGEKTDKKPVVSRRSRDQKYYSAVSSTAYVRKLLQPRYKSKFSYWKKVRIVSVTIYEKRWHMIQLK